MSKFPDGVFQYGGQPVGAMYASPFAKAFFVDGVDGVDDFDGFSPVKAKKTVQAAITAATSGDVIYVRPKAYVVGSGFGRYTEALTVALAKQDLSIIGVTNSLNPDFGPRLAWVTATENGLTVNGPALHVENMSFFNEGVTSGSAVLLTHDGGTNLLRGGDGPTFYNCVFKGGLIKSQGGDGQTIRNCIFNAMYDGTYQSGISAVSTGDGSTTNARRLTIRDSLFRGGNVVDADGAFITVTSFGSVWIDRCLFDICAVDAVIATDCTGAISNCSFAGADIGATLTLGGLIAINNLYDVN